MNWSDIYESLTPEDGQETRIDGSTTTHPGTDHPQTAEAEKLIGEGATIDEAAKQLEISEQTFHRWRNQYGGMKADDAKRLKEFERENVRLKRIVADQALDLDALREVARRNF